MFRRIFAPFSLICGFVFFFCMPVMALECANDGEPGFFPPWDHGHGSATARFAGYVRQAAGARRQLVGQVPK